MLLKPYFTHVPGSNQYLLWGCEFQSRRLGIGVQKLKKINNGHWRNTNNEKLPHKKNMIRDEKKDVAFLEWN